MRAAHLPATPTTTGVGNQSGDMGSHGRQVFDDLLAGVDVFDRTAAVGTPFQRDLNMIVDVWGFFASRGRMAGLSSRFPLLSRRFAIFVLASKRRRLACRSALKLFDAILKPLDELTKFFDLGVADGQRLAQPGVLALELANTLIAWIGIHARLPTPPCHAVSLKVCAMEPECANTKPLEKISIAGR
ncbi:MAG: hypothetical protein JSU63_08390 [Phycisphaerales bacterium]|nr:MAG: hypothetical protein JSU63_08390 [Phycisphaerales bacterium]